MGKQRLENIKKANPGLYEEMAAKVRAARNSAMEKIEDISAMMDTQAQVRYYQMIMKEDHVDYNEAIRLTREDPKYSLGLKMCSPAVMTMISTKKGSARFQEWLTPEELKIYVEEVEPMGIRGLMKKEKQKQMRV